MGERDSHLLSILLRLQSLASQEQKKVLSIVDGEVTEKNILPISLSYDHRVINGADAGNFMNFLKDEIEKGVT